MPLSIPFAPLRDDFSEGVAALERNDDVVVRPATLALRFRLRQGFGGRIASAAAPSVAARSRVGIDAVRFVRLACLSLLALSGSSAPAAAAESAWRGRQLTTGPANHFFGYIGQCRTVPWNANGRYLLALETGFQDRLPGAGDAARVCVIDTQEGNRVRIVDRTPGWNPQQGTMFYWNPAHPETQFFFNDRDPQTGKVFTVLFDLAHGPKGGRVREYRFDGAHGLHRRASGVGVGRSHHRVRG